MECKILLAFVFTGLSTSQSGRTLSYATLIGIAICELHGEKKRRKKSLIYNPNETSKWPFS